MQGTRAFSVDVQGPLDVLVTELTPRKSLRCRRRGLLCVLARPPVSGMPALFRLPAREGWGRRERPQLTR